MQGTHAIIAMRRSEPHWLMTDQDAKVYGTAIANVMRHFSIGASQKAIDFLALFICATNMESPRIYMSMRNRQARRAGQQPQQPRGPAQVFEFTPRPASTPAGQPAPSDPAPVQQQPDGGGVEGFTGDGIDAPIGGH